jgi:hypothetical protein
MPVFRPSKTDIKFNTADYALYSSAWVMLTEGIIRQYKIGFADCRLMCGIEALMRLYGHRLNGEGITAVDIARMTAFHRKRVTRMMLKLTEAGMIQYTELMVGTHHIRYYRFTRRGKEVVNKLCDTEKVNEQIVSHLYNTKLLR